MTFLDSVRTAYDTVAPDYALKFSDELSDKPLDRALIGAFAELVSGPVADIGCGPGHITGYLASLGLDASGIDLSPAMISTARAAWPSLRFDVGSMLSLDLPDASLGGIVAFYSIIHVPTEHLPSVFAEFRRVLRPNGQLMLAFQTGDETLHRTEALGHEISLEYYLRQPALVAALLTDAGLSVHAQLVREPYGEEKVTRVYLMATA